MHDLAKRIQTAGQAGKLLDSSVHNILRILSRSDSPVVASSVLELADHELWDELNDRFYKTLTFGTGGLRGRTIGRIITQAERGQTRALDRPESPCVGTNAMNDFNVSRATQGLVAYLKEWFSNKRLPGRPKIVVAHDTRHFSKDFASLVARVATENGCDVVLFDGPRSTPQLSFTVRLVGASAGIVITASHNPPHDNGYKVYFQDGAQVVEPHAGGIISRVNAVESDAYEPVAEEARGTTVILAADADDAYMHRLESLVLDRAMLAKSNDLKIVFTSIHGTGGILSVPLLQRFGLNVITLSEQERQDGRFPTVKSPNPENAEALSKAISLAQKEGADLVMATDPDCDRMGVAVRNKAGAMELISGNQIAAIIGAYRVKRLKHLGIINASNKGHCVFVKTFVTTDLLKAIAMKEGLECVETLTGFKYIGEKLGHYEAAIPEAERLNYRLLSEDATRALRLAHSKYYVFGGEESYGYSAHDFVRDKDGNGSVLLFAEAAAYARSRGLTIPELLDELYAEYGLYLERNESLEFAGADGAAKIKRLSDSYASAPPAIVDGVDVSATRNFARDEIRDSEGQLVPKENMLMIDLADGRRVAVRPSGTEPKIKFYLFAQRDPAVKSPWDAEALMKLKTETRQSLDGLWTWLCKDVQARLTSC